MMRVMLESVRHDALEPVLDLERIFARREAGAVADPEDMGVDRDGVVAEGDVEHDIGGLAADARKRLERRAIVGHRAVMPLHQHRRSAHDVARLGAIETDGLDRLAQSLFAQRQHLLRRVDGLEQRAGRLVDRDVGRLGRERYSNKERIGVPIDQLGGGVGPPGGEQFEKAYHLGRGEGLHAATF